MLAAAALGGALGLATCKPAPVARTVDVVGDSITAQSHWNRDDRWRAAGRGLPAADDLAVDAFLGFAFVDVQDRLTAHVNDAESPRPSILVVALGINNASTSYGLPGWTTTDDADFSKLINTPHPDACVVVVLPAVGEKAPKDLRANVAEGRTSMRRIAAQRPRTVVVDWAPIVAAHPEFLHADGIHLADDHPLGDAVANEAPADAFGALLWAGVAMCPHPPA